MQPTANDGPPGRRRARFREARRDPGQVVLEGFHALKHALRFGARAHEAVTPDADGVLALAAELAPDLVDTLRPLVEEIPSPEFAGLAPEAPHTGVLARARRLVVTPGALLGAPGDAPIVLLDRPVHLGNLGATIRVAAAAGAAGVLALGPHDPWHPTAVRAAAGLQFALPVARADALPPTGRPLVALDPVGEPLEAGRLPAGALLAFGAERSGLAPSLSRRAVARFRIPMRPGVSSLNLATAVAVVLYADRWHPGGPSWEPDASHRDQPEDAS